MDFVRNRVCAGTEVEDAPRVPKCSGARDAAGAFWVAKELPRPKFCSINYPHNYENLDLIKKLIEMGANQNVQNGRPIRAACIKGYLEMVKYLVENGANMDMVDDKGNTPLSYAEQKGFEEIVTYLRSKKEFK